MGYTISDGITSYNILQIEINKSGTELDIATCLCDGSHALDTAVTLYNDSSVALFKGYVRRSDEKDEGATWQIKVYETADELKYQPYRYSGGDVFTRSSITIDALVDEILSGSGWTRHSSSSDATIVTLSFYHVNRLQALNKIIREIRATNLWFDDSSGTKYVYFGSTGTDRTATPIVYTTKVNESSSEERGITKVYVLGKDSTVVGSSGSTDTKIKKYQASDITTSAEADLLAASILADLAVVRNRYKLIVDQSYYQYDVMDKVRITGDLTDYYVREISHSERDIELTVDTGQVSLIETLGSRITEISGNFPSGTDASWSGGNTNVAANTASATTYVWEIESKNMISDPYIDVTIGSFIKSADVSAETDYLSDVSTVDTSSDYSNATYFSAATYIPSSSGVSCSAPTGFQFGIATINGVIRAGTGLTYVTITCQYDHNDGNWHSTNVYNEVYCVLTTDTYPFSLTAMIPGNTTGIRVRWRFTPGSNTFSLYNTINYSVQLASRHKHSVTTTYDKTTTGTPPTTVTVSVNGNSLGSVTPGTPVAISLTYLQDGKNTISITTPSGSDNQCSVNPTITYKCLGLS